MKRFLFTLSFCFVALTSQGQRQLNYTDFGGFIGTMNYNGEVATGEIAGYISEIRPSFGMYLRRTVASWFTLGLEGSYGFVHAKDANHGNDLRGYEVNTHMIQINPYMELNFSKFGKYRRSQASTFYLKTGGGINFYNPNMNEGVRYPSTYTVRPNSYIGYNFFGGVGVKIRTSYQGYINIEATGHFASFDDIEGFVHTDNRTNNDVYGGIRIGYNYMIF